MRMYRWWLLLVVVVGWSSGRLFAQRPDLSSPDFSSIDALVDQAVEQKQIPGAVVEVGHAGHAVFRKAYGQRSLEPVREVMTVDTVFDMASLTKVLMTATAVMQLCERGKLSFNDPVAKYLPDFAANGKQDITIRQLLTHYSGLPPDLSLEQPWEGKSEAFRQALATQPATPAGVRFVYSDINYIVLGALVEKLSGMPEDEYVERNIIAPLGLQSTRYLPPVEWRDHIAPTQYEHGVMLRGVVHDPTARRMGGVAGHAGLFSSADDVAVYAQNLLDRLAGNPSKFPVSRAILEKMVTPEQPATGTALRGFGWDIESPYSSNRGEIFPVGSFGHTGFTGTSLWIDPVSDSYLIVLTNAVHPDGGKSVVALRRQLADAAAAALGIVPDGGKLSAKLTGYNESLSGMHRWVARNGDVKTGIDVLEADGFSELHALAKKHDGHLRAGLLTNQTGVDASGRRTIDILAHADGIELKTLFSPEHGIRGAEDTENIGNGRDAQTGLPVVSLYGATDAQRRPPLDVMRSLDAVVIDLQDVGVRFYTYETVMGYFLEAAAKTGTEIVVLDRPNPINGAFVQGPLSDKGRESYVDYMPLPVRHGMTMGELARYFNGERDLHAPLTVVKMEGWQRGDWYDSTGLSWVNPSPNLRDLEEAMLYPALGLVETTNISVGRGTDTPFEILGAPWVDGRKLAHDLNARFLPGVRFVAVDFTPQKPYPYASELCHGVRVLLMDRNVLDAPELGIVLASVLHKLYSQEYKLERINRLLANQHVLEALMRGDDPSKIAEDWRGELEAFEAKRKAALLY
ncbi:exo-beta-N-acetylmuramidase NamZ domain-containing protein [Alloacidobacterium dinghuense]|uniref:exo-beta-N-acetylmuramidase NamZ domain-containing protein n=1 Tax=Alloacidobacterium dinghuense TaxID=2763107 RepID=UPI002036E769|nr:exo-beta-N-acetylmuramidase NamZ domain-containing protein [Alloacidobacterium dinghuense]